MIYHARDLSAMLEKLPSSCSLAARPSSDWCPSTFEQRGAPAHLSGSSLSSSTPHICLKTQSFHFDTPPTPPRSPDSSERHIQESNDANSHPNLCASPLDASPPDRTSTLPDFSTPTTRTLFEVRPPPSPITRLKQPTREDSLDLPTVWDLTNQVRITSQSPVAHGGFSDIHRGEWEHNVIEDGENRTTTYQVAIKLLRVFARQEVDGVRTKKRLNREVNVWHRLEHPNIAKFHGISYQMGGRPAMVMEWYPNGTAPQYLTKWPDADRLMLIHDIAQGLRYLHSMKCPIVHGDLKGNNILITDDGRAILSDFGLSKVLEDLFGPTGCTTTSIAGSVRWQAPQLLFDGEDEDTSISRLTLPSDVWSFGCTAYELLTGNLPYMNRHYDYGVILDLVGGVCPARKEDREIYGSREIWSLLHRCWALRPEDRPTMTEVEAATQQLCTAQK